MKKQFIIFMSLGILLLVIGTIGSATLFRKIEQEIKVVVAKEHQPKTEKNLDEVTLTVNGETQFTIIDSEDGQFHLNNTFYNVHNDKTLDWKIDESDKKTAIDVKLEQHSDEEKTVPLLSLGFWQDWSNTVIMVPKNIKKLTIISQTSHNVYVSNLAVDSLSVDVATNVSVDSISADTFSNGEKDSTISLSNSQIKDRINLHSKKTNLSVFETSFKNLDINSDTGIITLDSLVGNGKITNRSGQIYINQIKGETAIQSQSGNVEWNPVGQTYPLSIKTTSGQITANLQNKKDNFKLTAASKNGVTYVDGEAKDKVNFGKGKSPVSLNSESGNINININTYFENNDSDVDSDGDGVIDAI